ncbi:hypothetical protein GCM10007158_07100 [Vreelandella hamiltonii]|uniref:Uncharacterized protein n=2 Tax=Halomonadaceae TaxID=28256 RepID=A0A8H9I917_9GAMM|nr:hypothetical protein GCM10007157_27390 [Halomonas hamiltonii]GGW48620.1 hypothetical protein GCM10007158_07100 [Halomonas johnsoniae]
MHFATEIGHVGGHQDRHGQFVLARQWAVFKRRVGHGDHLVKAKKYPPPGALAEWGGWSTA